MRHIAIIGSGPAGYYTAEACQKQFGDDVRVDIIDRLPVPFGLIRTGVAPDHQSIKGVSRRYEAVALTDLDRATVEKQVKDLSEDVDDSKSDAERAAAESKLAVARAKLEALSQSSAH